MRPDESVCACVPEMRDVEYRVLLSMLLMLCVVCVCVCVCVPRCPVSNYDRRFEGLQFSLYGG